MQETAPQMGRHVVSFLHFAESSLLMLAFNVLADPVPIAANLTRDGHPFEHNHGGGCSGIVAYQVNKATGSVTPFAHMRLDRIRTEVNPSIACKGRSTATEATAFFAAQTSPSTVYRVVWNPSSPDSVLRVTGILDLELEDDMVWSLT